MKRYILGMLILIVGTISAQAQCDKQVKIKCEKTIRANPDGSTAEEQNMPVDILITKDSIKINAVPPEGGSVEIAGPLSEKNCKMTGNYTDGIYTFKSAALLKKDGGETREMNLVFKLEAKGGKITFYGEKDVPQGQDPERMIFEIKEQKVN
ncbi:MAG: hypothetical protein C5B52_04910 [Bacteroidetes bacterium]|nr:MAG: hypothetical protein C5B52_04910 [Bacteroidota bacterium]